MKLYHLILCCFYLLITNTSKAQTDLNKGLIGCYPFSGNANDLSDKRNHGKVTGAGLTADRFGNPNSAYEFDGIDDFIEISPKDLQINSFTYSIWVAPKELPTNSFAFFLISVGSTYGDQHILLGNQYTNERHNAFAHGSYLGIGNNVRCTAQTLPEVNKWYHLVLTKDLNYYYFYVNGQLICKNAVNGGTAFYGTETVKATIGARNNYGQASPAAIDDIHLYNRALSKEEVDLLFKGEINIPSTAQIEVTPNNPCIADAIQILAKTDINNPTFEWKIDNIPYPSATDAAFTYTLPSGNNEYDKLIEVKISGNSSCFNQNGAKSVKTIHIRNCSTPSEVTPRLRIPSAFTPNGDKLNDTWEILNWNLFPDFEIFIYNRWGEVIFYSKDYKNPWNGQYKGQLIPPGVYPYRILSAGGLLSESYVNVFH